MAMTPNAALGRRQAPVAELLFGLRGLPTRPPVEGRSRATPVASPPGSPFRLGRPLLPVYHLLTMSAGVERKADTTPSRPDTIADHSEASGSRRGPADESRAGDELRESAVDPEELHRLVVDHSDAVFRLALSVVRDAALAEDVAQEALVKAWLALPTFRGDASIRGWLLRITHNTAISTLRRRRAVVLDPHDLPERQTQVDRSVESRVQGQVVMDEFVDALDTLDELSRSIVVLRELEGFTYEEISEVLGVPMPTVKTRLLRARRRLGNALRDWA